MEPPVPAAGGRFATRAVRGAVTPDVREEPISPPIHPSSTWAVGRSAELAALLADERDGYVYGRYDNPTNTALHGLVAGLHGTEAAWSLASGTAAILATLEVLRRGGRVLASSQLYGGTYALLQRLSATAGWGVDHVDLTRPGAVRDAATGDHTVVYAETIANPTTAVADLAALAAECRDRGLALVVDNTFASPWLCRPAELGAAAVVESATKYLGGHGDVVAGVVAADRATVAAVRLATYELGASLGPFDAWLVARGIQTLHLRVERASRNAAAVAELLEGDRRVRAVRYPGLASHPQHDVAERQFGGRGYGGTLAFELGDRSAAEAFADACEVFSRAVSLGGNHSLVLHPASTTHRQLDRAALDAAGIAPGLVRMSVGTEDVEDLACDVQQALDAAVGRNGT